MLMLSWYNVNYVHYLNLACWHLLIGTKYKVQLRLMGMCDFNITGKMLTR